MQFLHFRYTLSEILKVMAWRSKSAFKRFLWKL